MLFIPSLPSGHSVDSFWCWSILYTTKICLLEMQFSKFRSQKCAAIHTIFHILWIPKTIFIQKKSPTSSAKVHNSLFYSVLKVVWCSKSHTELTAFLWVLWQMIHRKNLPEWSTCWTAQNGRLFFLSWPLHFRVSALNCNCVTHCMH